MLPARAGMSPSLGEALQACGGAPRTGGDEPGDWADVALEVQCSPHGRG